VSRALAALALAACALLPGCSGRGEVASVVVGAFAVELRRPEAGPWRGSWGDELRPGMKAVAVSPDLVQRGLERGTRVRIEGMPSAYRVRHQLSAATHERVEIFMGTDAAAAQRWHERRARIWWAKP
jgi:hypothetical protein